MRHAKRWGVALCWWVGCTGSTAGMKGYAVVLAFVVRPDWPTRLAAVVVAVLAYPVVRTLLFRRT